MGTADAVVGDVVAVAAALRDAASRGSILAAEATYTLTQDAVVTGAPLTVGSAEARRPPSGGAGGARRGGSTPRSSAGSRSWRGCVWSSTRRGRSCRIVTVLGEPGIGKTRLGRELTTTLASEATTLVGRCFSYGKGQTFLPLIDAFQQLDLAAALGDDTEGELATTRLDMLAGTQEADTLGEAYWAVRRLLEALAGASGAADPRRCPLGRAGPARPPRLPRRTRHGRARAPTYSRGRSSSGRVARNSSSGR